MNLGITKKVTVLSIGVILFLGLFLCFYFSRHETRALSSELNERATVLLNSLSTQSEYPILIRDREAISRLAKGVLAQKDVVFCRIADSDGTLLFEEGSKEEQSIREFTSLVVTKRFIEKMGEGMILGDLPLEVEEEIGKIYLAISLSGLHEKARDIKKTVALFAGVTIILASLASSLLLKLILDKPITVLVQGTERIAKGDLKYKVPVKSNDELGILATSFNKMTEALQRDIAERERAEAKLNETMKELSRSNAELQQFAYVASHDLQEPLRMVSSYMQLLERRYKGKLDADADDFIGYAVDGAIRMRTLINDLLAYSRVGTRGKPFEPTDFEKVLDQALINLRVALEEHDATVTHDPLPTVMADGVQLGQLFQNLIGNAIKFHGELPPRVHVSAEQKENEWVFSVRDSGIGIDPQYAERIFLIFQRLHTKSEYPGTGIGLAVCMKIVKRHGGHLWVESQPSKGSTFYFTIPRIGANHDEQPNNNR